jgi:hypothetical protein
MDRIQWYAFLNVNNNKPLCSIKWPAISWLVERLLLSEEKLCSCGCHVLGLMTSKAVQLLYSFYFFMMLHKLLMLSITKCGTTVNKNDRSNVMWEKAIMVYFNNGLTAYNVMINLSMYPFRNIWYFFYFSVFVEHVCFVLHCVCLLQFERWSLLEIKRLKEEWHWRIELKSLLSLAHVLNSKWINLYIISKNFLATMVVSLIWKQPLIKECKLRLQNYAAIIPTVNSCLKFKINNTNSLQRYCIAQNYRILPKAVQNLS